MSCLEITTAIPCTNMCTYCPQSLLMKAYKSNNEYMQLDVFKICLNKVPKNVEITFAGYAEPFLNQNTIDYILYAKELGYVVNLNTTLVGLNLEQAKKLCNIKLDHICLHLPDDNGYMKCTITDEYIEVLKLINERFPKNYAHVFGSPHHKIKNLLSIHQREIKNLHTRANNVNYDKVGIEKIEFKKGKIQCGPIYREGRDIIDINVLLPNGDVTLCCMDYGLKHKLGNLLIDSYEDLFLSTEYKKVQMGLSIDSIDILCRTCSEAIIV